MDYLDKPRNKSDDLQTIRFDSNSNEKYNFTKKLVRYKCCLFRIFHKSIDKDIIDENIIDKNIIDENIDIYTHKRINWNICSLFH
jgi:hypothetical protein